jgi:PAS domain S-box-containing protein
VQHFQEPAGAIFAEMQIFVPSTGITLMLDINKINDTTLMAVLQNVSELTESRREVVRRTESQRLLASVFMRLNTPVIVNRADGIIVLTNSAFQRLMGYDSKTLNGLNIDALLPPNAQGAARAARTQQMIDGKAYQVDVEVVAKNGLRFQVGLHSALLDEANAQHMRVVTLVPHVKSETGISNVSQVKTLDLSKFITEVGGEWPKISERAMMLIELLIKTFLSPYDVLKRGKDNNFVIWFSGGDPARISDVLARAERAVHRVFITEFGTRIAKLVTTSVDA